MVTDQKVLSGISCSFLRSLDYENDGQDKSHCDDDGENHANPLSGRLLMSLSLNYLFVGLDNIIFNNFHILVGSDQLCALLGCVLLKLTCYLIYVVHEGLCNIEHLLSLSNNLGVKVDFTFYSDCIFVDLRLSLSFLHIVIDACI
jgi:hypothetical protein